VTEEEREQLREFFVKYQLMRKLNIQVEYAEEDVNFWSTMQDRHRKEYIALWEEVATEYNGEPWKGGAT
jgi:hypothetical protein